MNSIKAYCQFFESINQNTSIEKYKEQFNPNAVFKDPFHKVQGIDAIYNVFQKMYKNLDNPYFKVHEAIQKENVAYIKWGFYFSFKKDTIVQNFTGVSRVKFDDNGKVLEHIDFWDSAENIYEKIPFISHIIKFIKRRIVA